MIKQGIFHPQLLRVLGETRHTDTIIVADAGLPIPKGVERIDLGWKAGSPGCLEVLEEIAKVLVIEKAIFANEALERSPDLHKEALKFFPQSTEVEYVPHTEFKEMSKDAKAIVLTGEFTVYTNVILVAGCAY